MSTQFDLSDLDNSVNYESIEVNEGNQAVPDGRYQAVISKVHIGKTKNGDRRIYFTLKILGPKHAGRCVFMGHNLETTANLSFLKKDLVTCGLRLTSWSELPERLGDLLDTVVEIQTKTKGDYQNCYINRKIQLADGVTPQDLIAGGSSEDDEAPF